MIRPALSHGLHLVTEAAIGLLGVLALASCVLAWRLAQGPIDITDLAQRFDAALAGPGVSLHVGSAALAWEGFREADRALDVRVSDVTISNSAGIRLVQVPRAGVTLALGPLLFGHVTPRTLELEGAIVELRRNAQGSLDLDLSAIPSPGPAPPTNAGNEILRQLAKRPGPGDALPWLSQLSRVWIRNTQITIRDSMLGVIWQAPRASVDMKRLADGGISAVARLDLAVGDVRGTLSANAQLSDHGTHVVASLSPISPAGLARTSPVFSRGAVLDALVTASLEADLDPFLVPRSIKIMFASGAGKLNAGQGAVPLRSAAATVLATPASLQLIDMQVALSDLPGTHGPAPVIRAGASATRSAGRIATNFAIAVDSVRLRDLPSYWPPGTGGGSRSWLTENLTGGTARGAHVSGTIDASNDLTELNLRSLDGGLDAEDVAVSWLKPIPPIEHGRARVRIESPDALDVAISSGDQGGLKITNGNIRITGLSRSHQIGAINVDLDGGLSDTLSLLNHPRLKLLSRRKLDLTNPAGRVRAKLSVTLPLEAKVDMDDIVIGATAALTDVHLENVVAGKMLDRGDLALQVDGNGLKLDGTGNLATIPANFNLVMDFRNGPKSQVLEHLIATGKADSAQLQAAGAPGTALSAITSGSLDIKADYLSRRDGTETVTVVAGLDHAALSTPFGWSKKQGQSANLGATVELQHGNLVALNHAFADGPGLRLSAHAGPAEAGGGARTLIIDKADVGKTSAQGRITIPEAGSQPIDAQFFGASLDLSPLVASSRSSVADPKLSSAAEPPPTTRRGRPWRTELAFDRVIVGKTKQLALLRAKVTSDGLHVSRAQVATFGEGAFKASIKPIAGGRAIAVESDDAGTALTALGLADNLRGGHLSVDGSFDDSDASSPLSGTAKLSEFSVTDAPAIGRLMQALTFYGVADLLRGPGLHFSRMVAPFRWQNRVLHLENARAFSSSLGLTAQGDIDLATRRANVSGTVVPAYFFNQLPGKIPLFGRLFAPEKGGGLFAARYSVTGPLSDPKIGVNPFSALTPGVLRGIFGLFSSAATPAKN